MIIGSTDVSFSQSGIRDKEVIEEVTDLIDQKNDDAWYLNSVVLNSANGKNSNHYGAKQPTNPKEGDLWFVYDANGQAVDMLRYINGKWVSEVDLTTGQQMIDAALELAKRIDNDKLELKNAETLWKADISTASASIMGSVNGIQSRVSNIENGSASVITQLSNQINLKVGKGDVISQINLEADSATIKSKAIVLAGDTTVTGTFAVPAAQVTGKLTANQIAVTQLSALTADLGSVTAGNITGVSITSNNGADTTNLTGGRLTQTGSFTRYFSTGQTAYYQSRTTLQNGVLRNSILSKTNSSGGSLTTSSSLDARSLYIHDKGMSTQMDNFSNSYNSNSGRYIDLFAKETYDSNFIGGGMKLFSDSTITAESYGNINLYSVDAGYGVVLGYNVYSTTKYNGELRSSNGNVSLNQSTISTAEVIITGNSISLGGGGWDGSPTTTYTNIGQNNVYVPNKVYAGGVALTSSRDKKKNIETFEDESLTLINELRAVKYQLKTDNDGELKRLGFILEEMSLAELIDPDGGVDQYALITLAIKAIQELTMKVEVLENA